MFFLRLNGEVNIIAGETIKGISVVIGSDTTGLTSALSDVNKASRGIQSELKQVERLLRLDPSNVELVAQQQQLLTDAVANTSEKLNRLRAAQEQVNEQFARGEISAGQYRAFQREIAATEQQLSRFESQLSGTANELNNLGDAAENNADKLKDIGDKVKGAGEKMSMAITAPIAAAGGLMLKGAIDAENAQNKLQASLGITADAAAWSLFCAFSASIAPFSINPPAATIGAVIAIDIFSPASFTLSPISLSLSAFFSAALPRSFSSSLAPDN